MIGNVHFNRRQATLSLLIISVILVLAITISGQFLSNSAMETNFAIKDISPCLKYPFGTDWMGRDMFSRTLAGLSTSIKIGLLTASASAVIAFLLGTAAATMGKKVDAFILWLIDLVMGIPHILLLILISFACGKGFWGVVIGVSLTHWPSLTRVIRGEVLQLKESGYIKVAQKRGVSRQKIVFRHMLPHILPQFLVGLILLFPHAILHEASITFLGFGLSPEQPAVGIILSESMRYLSMGEWWLALFPGLLLVMTVILFDIAGESLRKLLSPKTLHE
ncbi:MAG: ABC transporter permease [Oscillospiraceae bacterium]